VTVTALVGNPRPGSRTHTAALQLRDAIAAGADTALVDLAEPADADEARALVAASDVLVVASPTYKATYTGLLKVFLDGYGPSPLAGVEAVPLMVGAAPQHALAVDVHLTPLLLELGASVPRRGLYVLESELGGFEARARDWARLSRPAG
jgi:FMN reductase